MGITNHGENNNDDNGRNGRWIKKKFVPAADATTVLHGVCVWNVTVCIHRVMQHISSCCPKPNTRGRRVIIIIIMIIMYDVRYCNYTRQLDAEKTVEKYRGKNMRATFFFFLSLTVNVRKKIILFTEKRHFSSIRKPKKLKHKLKHHCNHYFVFHRCIVYTLQWNKNRNSLQQVVSCEQLNSSKNYIPIVICHRGESGVKITLKTC